jgi:hypothetical protein
MTTTGVDHVSRYPLIRGQYLTLKRSRTHFLGSVTYLLIETEVVLCPA